MLDLGPKARIVCSTVKSKYIRGGILLSIFLILVVSHEKLYYGKKLATSKDNLSLKINSIMFNEAHKSRPSLFPQVTSSNPPIRILCYVLLSRSQIRTGRLIKETWGSHCDELLFFGGYEYPSLPVTHLNVTEGYENLWGKAKAALIYLSETPRFKNFDYFMKADDDTFVIVENLRKFIINSTQAIKKPVWFGFRLKHKQIAKGYFSGGAGYVFNYAALLRVSVILTKSMTGNNCNVNGEYGIEDLELGKCFLSAGVESLETTDEEGKERFLPLPYDVFLNGAISSFHWIWSQAWNRVRTGQNCCSHDLISMHQVSPGQMKFMYNLLYKIKV